MSIRTVIFFLLALLSLTMPTLTLGHPVDDQVEAQSWDSNTPEDLAALTIINDPTPKFGMNITFTNAVTGQNITAEVYYKCETTAGSPSVHWIRQLAEKFRTELKFRPCQQTNPFGSRCTKLRGMGDAAFSICGHYEVWTMCDNVGSAGYLIADHCEWKGLAGGRVLPELNRDLIIDVHKN